MPQVMNAARAHCRAMSATLDTELDGARTSQASKDYFKFGADIDQDLEESPELDAAFAVRVCEACLSQRKFRDGGASVTACDVEDYMEKRKDACTLFALRLAGWRCRVATCAMDDSPRDNDLAPRGDIGLYHRMQDRLNVMFAAFGSRQ